MKTLKRNFLRISLILLLIFGAFSLQSYAAPNEAASQEKSTVDVTEGHKKVSITDAQAGELTPEQRKKAEEDAKIKDELTREQKTMTSGKQIRVKDKDFDPNGNDALTKTVVPNTGTELVKLLMMFGKTMLAVVIASFLIYFILLFTKKFFHPALPQRGEEDFDIRDLNSPKSADEALRAFLDRTEE